MKKAIEEMNKSELIKEINELKDSIANQKSIIEKLKKIAFGKKREFFNKASIHPDQLNLAFEDLESKNIEIKKEKKSEEIEEVKYTRKKKSKHNGRNKLPDHLPVKEIIIEPEGVEGLVKIGEERTEVLEFIPGEFLKIIYVRPKYAKPNKDGVVIADMPLRAIDKCIAGEMLLAYILVSKYVDHLPIYRLRQMFKRSNIEIAPSTIDSWLNKLSNLLEPLYDIMLNIIKNDGYLQVDETPIPVLDQAKKGKTHRGYYWVYYSPFKKIVLFDYSKSRGTESPEKILMNYQGYLQTDGYSVYKHYASRKKINHLGCWAHVRRYYHEALDNDPDRAKYVLGEIQKLYAIEKHVKEKSYDEIKDTRIKSSLPIINDLGKWIVQEFHNVTPKSPIGKALAYTINIWDSLSVYINHGGLNIDNNPVERSIRPNAIGRKNYLFAGSHEGAKRSAMFYSFFGTCKIHNIDPQKWLFKVLCKIPTHDKNKLYQLLPQNINLEN